MGGIGATHWDILHARIPFKGAAELGRILGSLGRREIPAADAPHLNLGFLPVDDFSVYLTVTFVSLFPAEPPSPSLTICLEALPWGASRAEVKRARKVEALLGAQGIPPALA
jgi:hypothetical protein